MNTMQQFTLHEVLAQCESSHDPDQRQQNLLALLEPDEPIYAFLDPGLRLLLATEKRLVTARLQREGFSRPRLTWLTATYDYEDISAVQYVEAMADEPARAVVTYMTSELVIADTPRLYEFSQIVGELMGRWKVRLKSAEAAPQANLPAQLRELHALHEAGILNAEEYTAAKRKMLGL